MEKSIIFYHQHGGGLKIGPDHPDPTRGFIRGTEIALVRLAQELKKLGWTVWVCLEGQNEEYRDSYGVWWEPLKFLDGFRKPNPLLPVMVSLLTPDIFRTNGGQLNVLWGHYAHLNVGRLDARIHHYILGTNWHQWSVREHDPRIDSDKCVVIGSGIDLERYTPTAKTPIYGRLVYSSSADRGLHHLLRMWPALKASMPHLSLKVFYDPKGMEMWRWAHETRAEWARTIDEGSHLDGVEFTGPVDPWTLAQEQMQADLFVYPCDPAGRTESFALSVMEMCAAGVPMLLAPADCLTEVYGEAAFFLPLPVRDSQWIEQVGWMLSNREAAHTLVPVGLELARAFDWTRVAERWDYFLTERLVIPTVDRDAWTTLGEDVTHLQSLAINGAKMRADPSGGVELVTASA